MKKILFLLLMSFTLATINASAINTVKDPLHVHEHYVQQIDKKLMNELKPISFTVSFPICPGVNINVTITLNITGVPLTSSFSVTGSFSISVSAWGYSIQIYSYSFRQPLNSNCNECSYNEQVNSLDLGDYQEVKLESSETLNAEVLAKTPYKDSWGLEPVVREAVFNSEQIRGLSLMYIKAALMK